MNRVEAAILEPDGRISVITDGAGISTELLNGVIGAQQAE